MRFTSKMTFASRAQFCLPKRIQHVSFIFHFHFSFFPFSFCLLFLWDEFEPKHLHINININQYTEKGDSNMAAHKQDTHEANERHLSKKGINITNHNDAGYIHQNLEAPHKEATPRVLKTPQKSTKMLKYTPNTPKKYQSRIKK